MPARDQQLFTLRLERYFQNLFDGVYPLYGKRADFDSFLERLVTLMVVCYRERPDDLKQLDIERDLTPDWFQRESMLGYVFYVERFFIHQFICSCCCPYSHSWQKAKSTNQFKFCWSNNCSNICAFSNCFWIHFCKISKT
mgnify:CR=1 FL=1